MSQGELFRHVQGPQFAPVPGIQQHLKSTTNWSDQGMKPMSTQSRYALFKAYDADRQRVNAGGSPAPGLVESYDALRTHIGTQFDQITNDPATPKPVVGDFSSEGGYSDAGHLTTAMRQGSFNVNRTKADESTVAWDNKTNDKFRAVHDIIGHGGAGASFSPEGESLATESQRRASPRSAHRAITAEVLGQAASWEFTGNFVEQRGLYDVPKWAVEGRSAPRPPRRSFISRAKQGRLFT